MKTEFTQVTVQRNHDRNGIEIGFPDKPPISIRNILKDVRLPWRWNSERKVWYRKYDSESEQIAHLIAEAAQPFFQPAAA